MQPSPIEEWQRLTEHYREVGDEELLELARDFADLTETAQQTLRGEMRTRGLPDPLAPRESRWAPGAFASPRFVSSIDPDRLNDRANSDVGSDQGDSAPEYTWKTPLCEVEDRQQAWQLREVLERAGIESWVEQPGSAWAIANPRILVAADRREEALEIAARPIPQDIVDLSTMEVPEFEPPKCPKCGVEDPVLESAEPANSWLCESCGCQWTEPSASVDGEPEAVER